MVRGTLKPGFNKDRGFGFIAPLGGGEDVFLHVRDLADPNQKDLLVPGAPIEWEHTMPGQQGKPRAVRARVLQAGGDATWFALGLQRVYAAIESLIEDARAHGMDV